MKSLLSFFRHTPQKGEGTTKRFAACLPLLADALCRMVGSDGNYRQILACLEDHAVELHRDYGLDLNIKSDSISIRLVKPAN